MKVEMWDRGEDGRVDVRRAVKYGYAEGAGARVV